MGLEAFQKSESEVSSTQTNPMAAVGALQDQELIVDVKLVSGAERSSDGLDV
jgi:hypothetical protein